MNNSIFGGGGSALFSESKTIPYEYLLSLINSNVVEFILSLLNPTLNFLVGDINRLPIIYDETDLTVCNNTKKLVELSKQDWDSYETSWEFDGNPIVKEYRTNPSMSLDEVVTILQKKYKNTVLKARDLEIQNNQSFIELYGLNGEISTDYPLSEVTLFTNTAFMYKEKSEDEQIKLQRVDMIKDLISYSVGCMFGRYSLDKEGLILCNQGETIVDFKAKVPNSSFEVDEDNVIPVLSDNWFSDDIVERFKNFLKVAFGEEHYLENLRFIEQTLNVKEKNSYSIRDYFVNEFYSDHIKRYKKRPIYWMFKTPKGHFKALIYMHRYQPYTVSRARNE